ncbi:hypothetical protein J4Q44_G00227470 [Coregonus suidteri]|uniref:Uncharacterized protein n=1 Tax=Coregonus suidteri TaxID=861788 RepID=A0AAN8LAF2_9TELE
MLLFHSGCLCLLPVLLFLLGFQPHLLREFLLLPQILLLPPALCFQLLLSRPFLQLFFFFFNFASTISPSSLPSSQSLRSVSIAICSSFLFSLCSSSALFFSTSQHPFLLLPFLQLFLFLFLLFTVLIPVPLPFFVHFFYSSHTLLLPFAICHFIPS